MSLTVPHTVGGVRMLISQDVLDIAKRIQNGDATCGWDGDPRMYVLFNNNTHKYEVWRHAENNKHYIISSWEPSQFNAQVIVSLARGDARKRGMEILDEIDKHNDSLERERVRKAEEAADAGRDFLKYVLKHNYVPGYWD